MLVNVFNRRGELVGPVESPRVVKSDAEWRAQLTPEQFQIARGKGTERLEWSHNHAPPDSLRCTHDRPIARSDVDRYVEVTGPI